MYREGVDLKDPIADRVINCFIVSKGDKVRCLETLNSEMGYLPVDLVQHVIHSTTMLSALIRALKTYGASQRVIKQVEAIENGSAKADLRRSIEDYFTKLQDAPESKPKRSRFQNPNARLRPK